MRPFALLVLPTLIACPTSPPPPAAPTLPDVVQLVPDTSRFRLAFHRRIEHVVRGQPVTASESREAWITARLMPEDGGDVTAQWVVDSLRETVKEEVFSPLGLEASRESQSGDIGPELRPLLPGTAPGGARLGGRWTDTTSLEARMTDLLVTVTTVSRHEVGGWTTWAAAPALEILSAADYTVTGEGTHLGQDVRLSGTGRRQTRHYLSPSGLLLAGIAADTANFDVRVVATGLVIPAHQWRADTVEARR